MQLLSIDVSKAVIGMILTPGLNFNEIERGFLPDYVVDYVSHIVGHPVDHPSDEPIILFPMTRGRSQSRRHRRPAKISPCSDATSFVERVLHKARVKISEVLATLAYIDRARPYLQISSDTKYPFERVLLGALIIATKVCFSPIYSSPCMASLQIELTVSCSFSMIPVSRICTGHNAVACSGSTISVA